MIWVEVPIFEMKPKSGISLPAICPLFDPFVLWRKIVRVVIQILGKIGQKNIPNVPQEAGWTSTSTRRKQARTIAWCPPRPPRSGERSTSHSVLFSPPCLVSSLCRFWFLWNCEGGLLGEFLLRMGYVSELDFPFCRKFSKSVVNTPTAGAEGAKASTFVSRDKI